LARLSATRIFLSPLNQHPWIELKADAVLIIGFDSAKNKIQEQKKTNLFAKNKKKLASLNVI
jgi:hypothetical protein